MPSLSELSLDELRDAGDAVETLIEFRDYLPPGDTLLALALSSRDDIREILGMPPLERAVRGSEARSPEDLTDANLLRLGDAVSVLLERYTPLIEEPRLIALLMALQAWLAREALDRVQHPARKTAEEAKAS